MRLRPFLLVLAIALQGLLAVPAQADKAKDLLDEQDFSSSPAKTTSPLSDWIEWVQHEHAGDYERTGGQPFSAPVPPGLPGDVDEITILVSSGTRSSVEGGVLCTVRWYQVFVSILFDDGSRFVWMEDGRDKSCEDGTKETWVHTIGSAGVEDPLSKAWSGWVRSQNIELAQIERRTRLRAPAGGTLDLSSLAPGSLPWTGSSGELVDVTVGPGGVLDLTGNSAAGGPLFMTDGPITLRCDTVLLDPGVVLSDLFSPPPLVLPGAVVHELALLGPAMAHLDTPGPAQVGLRLFNLGNAPELATVDFIDVLGWSLGGPALIPLEPFEQAALVQVPLLVPPFAQPGDSSALLAQASSAQAPQDTHDVLLERVALASPPSVYCTAKQNSLGCLPQIASSGMPTVAGYDDFHVLVSSVISNLNGILFHGSGATSVPFQGGTLCVQAPVTRTPVANSGGNPGNGDCSGVQSFHFDHDYLSAAGLSAGANVWCQFWTRDPASLPFGSGLSDALAFTVSP